jgi:hypothetical protein
VRTMRPSDFQKLTASQLESPDTLFLTLAEMIVDQLGLEIDLESAWNPRRGWNVNVERFLRRQVLEPSTVPLVWALDEVDRLFHFPYGCEIFGLFRSWHNERSLDPRGPWSRLTLAMAYATEAHLFIRDLNQSPFNVGTRLTLEDFTPEQVADLNRRCGAPLSTEAGIPPFIRLVGGHPYLVRRGLYELVERSWDWDTFVSQAKRETGPYGDHLRRLRHVLEQAPELCESLREVLRWGRCGSADHFYRLRAAGVVLGDSAGEARPRCQLYECYLTKHLL